MTLSLTGAPAATPLGYYSWTFGQCARDPYYIMVIIYIFVPYFSNTVVGDPVRGQSLIGYMNATVGVILALTAPLLGAIADKNGRRKPWVGWTGLVIAAGAFALWFVHPHGGLGVWSGLAILLLISVAFSINEVFHNAMLPSVAPVDKVGSISGIAFAIGNVGGLLLMLFVLFAFAMPGTQPWSFLPDAPLFGIDQALNEHDRLVGPIAGVWVILFMLPVLFFTPDGQSSGQRTWTLARQGLADVMQTFRELRHYSNIALYLLSRMFFIDGMIGVMTFGGVYASGTFGWDTTTLLIFGLCTSGSAMLGAYLGGKLDDRLGSIRTLLIAIGVSTVILIIQVSITRDSLFFFFDVGTNAVWASPYFSTTAELIYFINNQFFAMFFVTGLSSSRTLMARISPPERMTQFFGLFALSSTVTAFLAPLLVATTTAWFASQRVGFGSLSLLMLIGFVMLFWVREEQTRVAS